VIPATLDYVRAPSLDAALAALEDPEAKALAGGQSLLSLLKLRVIRPTLLVDIGGLELRGVVAENGGFSVGALTVWRDLAATPQVGRPALAALADCALGIGDLQVRNRGTIGGSLAHADPASDFPAVAIALGATLRLRSAGGTRSVEATDFFLGPFTTPLAPGELVTDLAVPAPAPGSGSAYASVEHPASGFAVAGAAALVLPDGSRRVAVTGVGAQAVVLAGEDPVDALRDLEIFGDDYAPAEYKRHLASVVVRHALERAEARAQEDAGWQT
jgi:carbon-monoxide dehydrogenase medium subunit